MWHYLWWYMHFQYLTGLKGVGVGWEQFVHTGHNLYKASDIPPDIWHNLENKPNQTCLLTKLIHCIHFIEALYSIFSYKEFCIHFQYSCSCKEHHTTCLLYVLSPPCKISIYLQYVVSPPCKKTIYLQTTSRFKHLAINSISIVNGEKHWTNKKCAFSRVWNYSIWGLANSKVKLTILIIFLPPWLSLVP